MAFNKNFVVKNGIEISTDLIYATNDLDKVGLGTTVPASKLDVIGDVTAYGNITADGGGLIGGSSNITGLSTVTSGFNVGTGGTALKVIVGSAASIGINTSEPSYPLDVRGTASIGQTAAYFYGDLVVTGNLSGTSFDGAVSIGGSLTATDLNISGILTAKDSEVYTQFDIINNGSAAYQYQSTGIGFTVNRDDPAIYLIRGKQYRFNVNATGYPFYIKTSPTTGTNSRFDRGVQNNGAQVGIITFRVPFDAPRKLYYQASNQAGMGATIYILKEQEPLPTGLSTVQTTVQYLNVTGFATAANLRVTGLATVTGPTLFAKTLSASQLNVSGVSTFIDTAYFGGGQTQILSSGELKMQNLDRIMLGYSGSTPTGLVIRQNDSSNVSEITNVGGDDIQIQADSGRRVFIGNDNTTNALTVTGTGVTVTGTTFTNQLSVSGITSLGTAVNKPVVIDENGFMRFPDRGGGYGGLTFGDGADLEINAAGTTAKFQTTIGSDLKVIIGSNTNFFEIAGYNSGTEAKFIANGGSQLYYANSKKIETIGAGVTVTGTVFTNQLNVSGVSTFFNDVKVGSTLTIRRSNGNASFSGIVTATKFVGDGSGLTGAGSTVADDTSTNSTFYPLFTSITSGTVTASKVSTTKLTFNPSTGTLTATNLNSSSDITLKENVETVEGALDKINDIRGVKFNWKEDGRASYGVIAQELEKVLPELVNNADHKTVNYNGIIGVLIEAVKDLSQKVDDLEEVINNRSNT